MYAKDITPATIINGTEKALGLQSDSLRLFPISLLKGANGVNGLPGSNGADGVGVPTGGTANQVLAKVDATNYNTQWVDPASGSGGVITNRTTLDTTPYFMSQGEIVILPFSSVTSLPLYITTTEGLYELTIIGDYSASITNNGETTFSPNNSTVSNVKMIGHLFNNTNATIAAFNSTGTGIDNKLRLPSGLLLRVNMEISTYTLNKSSNTTIHSKESSGNLYRYLLYHTWDEAITAWTSLGTLTFPFTQSGTIIIKRVI